MPEEAIYPIARTDTTGSPLNGRKSYRIAMKATPPVRAFWSITLYDDRGAMVANPIKRHSIGNRTSGITRSDGTLRDVVISSGKPEDADAIWLPAPSGPFYLMMRLYGPETKVQTGKWMPPAIQAMADRP